MAEPIDAYLDQLERGLDLPSAERAAVREEIAAHLLEEQARLIGTGSDPGAAAAEAIQQQGDALVLGRALTRARQSRRALLAAAGAGTMAAAGAGVRAVILGAATLVAILLAVGLVAAVARRSGVNGGSVIVEPGWFTAVGATTFWFGAWAAGRSFVAVAARESHRPAARLRSWIALLGGLGVAWLVLVWLRVPQNPASVLVLVVVPASFVAAALTGTDRPIAPTRLARRGGLALFVTLAFGLPVLALLAAAPVATSGGAVGSGPYASMADLLKTQNFNLVGRLLNDVPDIGGSSWTSGNGVVTVTVDGGDALTNRWHDLRFEAWRATPGANALDLRWTTPFASTPAQVTADGQLAGSLRVDGTRNASDFIVVLTGVAADGQRDFITGLGGTNTWFTGSVLGWLTAP